MSFKDVYYSGANGVKHSKGLKSPVRGTKESKAKPPVYWEGRVDWSKSYNSVEVRSSNLPIKAGFWGGPRVKNLIF